MTVARSNGLRAGSTRNTEPFSIRDCPSRSLWGHRTDENLGIVGGAIMRPLSNSGKSSCAAAELCTGSGGGGGWGGVGATSRRSSCVVGSASG